MLPLYLTIERLEKPKYTNLDTDAIINTKDLVDMVKMHNRHAFSELYNRYAAMIKGLIVKITHDYTLADDLLQDVFVRIWRGIETYDELKGTFLTWMVRVTRNTITDYYRSKNYKQQRIQKTNSDELYKLSYAEVDSEKPSDTVKLVYKLEAKYRPLVELVYIYGYTQEEVSRMLDLPLGTVKTRSRTAIQLLRSMMEQ